MKKILLTFAMCLCTISIFAADLYVNGSGLPTTYANLQLAIDAASDGDNIYMSSTETHNGPVTVDKSVYIISDQAGLKFQLVGDIIVGNNIEQVTIVGANGISVSSQNNAGSRVHVNLISSSISGLNISHNNYKVNIYDCFVGGTAAFRNGVVIGSELSAISIQNESSVEVDTIKLIANEFETLEYSNQMHNFEIYNNYVNKYSDNYSSNYGLYFSSIPNSQSTYGIIANNTIEASGNDAIFLTSVSDFSGLTIVNNYFTATENNSNYCCYTSNAINFASNAIPNTFISNNRYTGYSNISDQTSDVYSSDNSSAYSSYDGSNGNLSSGYSNLGLDQAAHYDIDGTINDIGTSGGPHAWSNYHTTGGKAVIFDLEIPAQIYMGTNQSIKAKGVHKN